MVARVLLLIAALVVAALGAVLVFLYARQADVRARDKLDTVEVLVATQDVQSNTLIDDAVESFELQQLVMEAVPGTAVTDIADVVGTYTNATILQGEPLLAEKLTEPGQTQGLDLAEGHVAGSFQFADPNRVGGNVQVQSEVAVFLTEGTTATDSETGATTTQDTKTQLLVRSARVIAIGDAVQTAPAEGAAGVAPEIPVPGTILTLSLTQKDLERMVRGQTVGELYLALLDEQSELKQSNGTTSGNMYLKSG